MKLRPEAGPTDADVSSSTDRSQHQEGTQASIPLEKRGPGTQIRGAAISTGGQRPGGVSTLGQEKGRCQSGENRTELPEAGQREDELKTARDLVTTGSQGIRSGDVSTAWGVGEDAQHLWVRGWEGAWREKRQERFERNLR